MCGGGIAFYLDSFPRIAGASAGCYAVLRSKFGTGPHLTRSRDRYFELVKFGTEFAQDSISRAFVTEAEARVYLLGADQDSQVPLQ